MRRLILSLAVAAGVSTLFAGPAYGQGATSPTPRPERPYTGLFAGGVGDVGQLLIWHFSAGTGIADQISAQRADEAKGIQAATTRGSQVFGVMNTDLGYSVKTDKLDLFTSGTASFRRYTETSKRLISSQAGMLRASYIVGRYSQFTAYQDISHQPLFWLALFPSPFEAPAGQTLPTEQDLGTNGDYSITTRSSLGFDHQLTRRTKAALFGQYDRTTYEDGSGIQTLKTLGGEVRRNLLRGLDLKLKYSVTEGHYPVSKGPSTVRVHNIDFGFDYERELAISRRTSLDFSTGSLAYYDGVRHHYRFLGNVHLNREIGRTWYVGSTYSRNATYVREFGAPAFSDSGSVGFGGFISRRVEFHSAAGVSKGTIGTAPTNRFDGYYGTSGATIGLTRHLGLDLSYLYYRYSFDTDESLRPGVFTHLRRQSFNATLTLWQPLVNRGKREK